MASSTEFDSGEPVTIISSSGLFFVCAKLGDAKANMLADRASVAVL